MKDIVSLSHHLYLSYFISNSEIFSVVVSKIIPSIDQMTDGEIIWYQQHISNSFHYTKIKHLGDTHCPLIIICCKGLWKRVLVSVFVLTKSWQMRRNTFTLPLKFGQNISLFLKLLKHSGSIWSQSSFIFALLRGIVSFVWMVNWKLR